jgi:hypothetical protein
MQQTQAWGRAWALAVSVVLGGLTGCQAARPAVLYGSENHLTATDYPRVLRTWTRSAKIYRGLDDKLFVTATYHAPELRRAFALAFPDIYGHGGKITRRELVDLTGGVEQHHNFLLAVYTPDVRWNDMGRDDSIWRLSLKGSQDIEVGPDEVVPIKMDENLRAVYPYISRFDKVYLVRFPLVDPLQRMVIEGDASGITLRIASALGGADMHWLLNKLDLARGPTAPMQHFAAPENCREPCIWGSEPWPTRRQDNG